MEVGRAGGLRVAAFFSQMAYVCSIHYQNMLEREREFKSSEAVCLSCLPVMDSGNLPSYSYFGDIAEEVAVFAGNQASNMHKADWCLFNTFDALEHEGNSSRTYMIN
ncbi:unnamed protein product [Cuscuta europaea]|uniref:Uncharacterized protein n=1 Tax=Cuscuta europaea TaxID=41803 RepID=A0A9P0YLP9_CUSEU|nr:unnamed protein product [Cuscuta europaea]